MIYRLMFIVLFLSLNFSHTFNQEFDKPILVILDTDMGSDCDDVWVLALLNAYADMGRVKILGCIYSSGKVP